MDEARALELWEDLMVVAEAVDGTAAEQSFGRLRMAAKRGVVNPFGESSMTLLSALARFDQSFDPVSADPEGPFRNAASRTKKG